VLPEFFIIDLKIIAANFAAILRPLQIERFDAQLHTTKGSAKYPLEM
jgi:hypothetical protein